MLAFGNTLIAEHSILHKVAIFINFLRGDPLVMLNKTLSKEKHVGLLVHQPLSCLSNGTIYGRCLITGKKLP